MSRGYLICSKESSAHAHYPPDEVNFEPNKREDNGYVYSSLYIALLPSNKEKIIVESHSFSLTKSKTMGPVS